MTSFTKCSETISQTLKHCYMYVIVIVVYFIGRDGDDELFRKGCPMEIEVVLYQFKHPTAEVWTIVHVHVHF